MSDQSEDLVLLDDGLVRPFTIDRAPGIHGKLTGERRVMLDREVQQYGRMCERLHEQKQSAAAEEHRNKLIASKLVSWDAIARRNGDQVEGAPIDAATIARLHPVLLTKLEAVVLGVRASDEPSDQELLEGLAGN